MQQETNGLETARKLGKLEESLAYHQQALVLKPMASSTYAAIGYVQTLMQKYFEVITGIKLQASYIQSTNNSTFFHMA